MKWTVHVMVLWGGRWTWAKFTFKDEKRARKMQARARLQGRNNFLEVSIPTYH